MYHLNKNPLKKVWLVRSKLQVYKKKCQQKDGDIACGRKQLNISNETMQYLIKRTTAPRDGTLDEGWE